ncbi:Laminin-like protein epi-1 [Durusdinium trenchii]|uniref:Laminin-like protein epi-1 n=1 Tax=Durusdinium trenchii TaxID=1381693 RepID=A0ABP0JTG4_9DINO
MPRIPQSRSAGALPGVGKANVSHLQQSGGLVVADSNRMTWGTIDMTSDGPTAAMVKGWPRWAIPGFLDEVPPRLDLCRQRLLAAEIELGRAEKAGGLDIGDSAPEKAESVPAVLQDLPPLAGPDDGPDEFAHLPHEGEMLLEQVSELEAQLSSTEVKFKDLETSHAAARQQRNAYSSQLDSSTEQISALAARIAALAGELDTSQQHNQELKGKIVASRANTQKLQQQLLKSDREVAHARYENCKLEEFLQSTRGVAEDFRDRLEVSEAEQDKLRARIRELQESNEAVREDANQRIEELEEALQEADSSIEELQQEKETLEQNRNRLAESLQAQKEQTSAQEQLVASLRQQQVQEERSKAAVQKQLDGKEKEVEELQKQLERMAQTIEEAEQSRAAAEERAAASQEPPDTAAEVAANEKAGNQRVEELEEALRQHQVQEERSKAAIQKQLEGKDKEVEELQKQLVEMAQAIKQAEQSRPAGEEHADAPQESPEKAAEVAARVVVSHWVEKAGSQSPAEEKSVRDNQQTSEWLSQWDSEDIFLTVPMVMASGMCEQGLAPTRVGLKGSDFLIQPLLPAGPPERMKLSSVKSISTEVCGDNVSLLLDIEEGGAQRRLQLKSDEESTEALLATLTLDVRVMPGEELKR